MTGPGDGCSLIQMQAVEYFLDLLDAEETGELKGHIKQCPECSMGVRRIRGDFEGLARWDDVVPTRKSIVQLVRAYGGDDGELTVVLPGEEEEEAGDGAVVAVAVVAEAGAGMKEICLAFCNY